MRIVFAGTPLFAERALTALAADGHDIALVLTRPDQAAGRGQQLRASPVKQRALALSVPVYQPASLRTVEARQQVADCRADVMVVAAYGLILPEAVLSLPRLGCLNIHASLLPRWRGAAPIQRAIEAGDAETGITIMQMDAGLDTGAMLLSAATPIGADESAGQLQARLAELGADLILKALAGLADGDLQPVAQPLAGVTYAHKVAKAEAVLDWQFPARRLADRIRAFDPAPGCMTAVAGLPARAFKVWRARPANDGEPVYRVETARQQAGTVASTLSDRIFVACGGGADEFIELLELQKPGGKRLPAAQFLRGFAITGGEQLAGRPPPALDSAAADPI